MKYFWAVSIISCTLFCKAHASLQITEVMYDPKSGGEWVEVYNPDDATVDLKGWKLFDGASHSISTSAQLLLPARSYIILADDKSAFVSAFNNVTVPVVDIVTSMNNDGDTVILRNPSGTDISTVVYTANAGASKNDKSLQLIGTEYLPWFVSIGTSATVTKEEIDAATPAQQAVSAPTSQTANASQTSSPYHAWPSDMEIFVSAGGDRVAVAGAEVTFQGRVLSAAHKSLPNADLIWTFGDGGSDRGTQVKHIFHYPGKYVVLLDVISGDNIAKDQVFVEVIQPKISISNVETKDHPYIEIYNSSIYDLDIGGWVLESNGLAGTHFTIPKNTIILAGRKVIFPSEITKLNIINNLASLKFPNDQIVAEYEKSPTASIIEETVDSTKENSSPLNTILSDSSEEQSLTSSMGEFFAKHISDSLFTNDSDVVESESLSTGVDGSTTTDATTTYTKELEQIQPASAAASGFTFSNYSKYGWLFVLLVGLISIFLTVRYIEKVEREESGITKEADEYIIIE